MKHHQSQTSSPAIPIPSPAISNPSPVISLAKGARSKQSEKSSPPQPTPSKRAGKFVIVGIAVTAFNYVFYAILANLIINNNDLIWLSNLIATVTTTFVSFFLHSHITWKERHITKFTICKFFLWNALLSIAICPALNQLFSYITPLYDFAFNISSSLGLPFNYEFILSSGSFALTSLIVMIANYFLYDRFVFGDINLPFLSSKFSKKSTKNPEQNTHANKKKIKNS